MKLSTLIVAGVAALGASVAGAQDVATGTAGLFDWNPHINVTSAESMARAPEVDVRLNVASPASQELAVDINPGLNLTTPSSADRVPVVDVQLNRTPPQHRR